MGEDIVISCGNCGKTLRADKKYAGRRAKCPHCGETLQLASGEQNTGPGKKGNATRVSGVDNQEHSMLGIKIRDDIAIVSFLTSRILDQSNVQQLGEEFDALVKDDRLDKIVLDFNNVHYMSSAVMGKLVGLHKKVQEADGELRLCNISQEILEIFEIMRFDDLFEICEDENEAASELMERNDRQQQR
ncbi:MAG: anti-sigma factor antagonist [Planctomycetota bacterium]